MDLFIRMADWTQQIPFLEDEAIGSGTERHLTSKRTLIDLESGQRQMSE